MDFKRMMIVMSLSMLILIGWEKMFPSAVPQQNSANATQTATTNNTNNSTQTTSLGATTPITVTTDTVKAIIDEKTGDLRGLTLLKYNSASDESKDLILLDNNENHVYIAQSNLVDSNGNNLLKNQSFTAEKKEYNLSENSGDKLEVRLSAPASSETNGLKIDKIYTFNKNSYVYNVRFEVQNTGSQNVQVGSQYQVIRDNHSPEGSGWFTQSYNGPVVYTPDADEFQKVTFSDLDDDFKSGKDSVEYQRKATGGYVGMIQHYFMTTWLTQNPDGATICINNQNNSNNSNGCTIDIKRRADNLYSAGVNTPATEIASGATQTFSANLYSGPQITSVLKATAPKLELSKDYGRVHIFASPLFTLLNWLHNLVGNWGWAIILLTVIVKAILFPLNNSAYQSMAKMRAVAPKLEALKKKYPNPEDRMAMQQAMMKLYQEEKINPLGGCLPMLIQMPIFIGLYWMIFLSVELRQAPWILWINDLSRADSWYILPILMAGTMWFQTTLNPPPSDPMQAQMMKIMPLMFSIMFFFFPSGLVLYYVINNLLTIAQQYYINKKIAAATPQGNVTILDKEPNQNQHQKNNKNKK